MITVLQKKCPSFNFIPLMLKEIGQELRSIQYLDYHENI